MKNMDGIKKPTHKEIESLKEALRAIRHATYARDTDDAIIDNIKNILTENGFPYEPED